MLIDLGVACAWIAMSFAGAVGLGRLRRIGTDSLELWADGDEGSCSEDPYSLDRPAGAGAVA